MKVLIFGPSNAGKTSLMRTACLGYPFVKVVNIKPTKGISRENFIFRGLLEITVWDAGGQERYIKRYFSDTQKSLIFGDVEVAVFVSDASDVSPGVRAIFDDFLEAIVEFSPKLERIYVLINKVDLADSKEEKVFKLLTTDLPEDLHRICTFSSVSVKTGSAQQQLIEILDLFLATTGKKEKLAEIQKCLQALKTPEVDELFLFNRSDGLLMSSTMGSAIETEPLKFLSFELGTLESNIYNIFTQIVEMKEKKLGPLYMSSIIYEARDSFVVIKEITDTAVVVVFSTGKTPGTLAAILEGVLSEENEKYMDLQQKVQWAAH